MLGLLSRVHVRPPLCNNESRHIRTRSWWLNITNRKTRCLCYNITINFESVFDVMKGACMWSAAMTVQQAKERMDLWLASAICSLPFRARSRAAVAWHLLRQKEVKMFASSARAVAASNGFSHRVRCSVNYIMPHALTLIYNWHAGDTIVAIHNACKCTLPRLQFFGWTNKKY